MDHGCCDRGGVPPEGRRRLLELCWLHECDLDPMILRARLLRHQGNCLQAVSVEQELLPLF